MMSEDERGEKRCQECGKSIPSGRSDRKFCSPECRNRWHYRKSGILKSLKIKTIGALDRNYAILSGLIEEGRTSIDIPDLAQRGYNFDCITSYHKVRNHDEYRCYDIKYFMSGSRIFRLERFQLQPKKP